MPVPVPPLVTEPFAPATLLVIGIMYTGPPASPAESEASSGAAP
jgi:hypothetical protein